MKASVARHRAALARSVRKLTRAFPDKDYGLKLGSAEATEGTSDLDAPGTWRRAA